MAGTDTVVGIVGAVVLVAVMVGVFAYEYNNAPAAAGGEDAAKTSFRSAYPGLNATGDLDGDKILNFEDPDLDGDRLNNSDDASIAVAVPLSGTVAQATTGAQSVNLLVQVEKGIETLTASISYDLVAPQPTALAPAIPTFQFALLDAAGETVVTGTNAYAGQTGTNTLEVDGGELAPGTYTLRVTASSPSPGGAFSGEAVLDYGGHAHESGHGHPG